MVHHGPLNSQVGHLGKRIANRLNIEPPKQKRGNGYNWFSVPFWGIKTNEGYFWILRPELIKALEELKNRPTTSNKRYPALLRFGQILPPFHSGRTSDIADFYVKYAANMLLSCRKCRHLLGATTFST